jgi:hypothetical protein
MKPSLPWLLPLALLAGGCVEDEADVRSTRVADTVLLANRDPGAGCRTVETVEVTSRPRDCPSRQALTAYAAARGANYVAVDTFTVYADRDEDVVLTRARVFACPLAQLSSAR